MVVRQFVQQRSCAALQVVCGPRHTRGPRLISKILPARQFGLNISFEFLQAITKHAVKKLNDLQSKYRSEGNHEDVLHDGLASSS